MNANPNAEHVQALTDLGIKEHEAKVYLACLSLGQGSVTQIAEAAGVQRTFVYDILTDLQSRGLVSVLDIRGKKHYTAITIEQFRDQVALKFRHFEGLIPEIRAVSQNEGQRPRVQFFEGIEGVKTALMSTLDQPYGSSIIGYATAAGLYSAEPKFIARYIKERVRKNIFVREIAPDNSINRAYRQRDSMELRTSLLVPETDFQFTNELNIYGNKLLILSLQDDYLAVIIESQSVANTQRSIFELAWRGAKSC